jgi:hypothetical protein
MGSIAARWQRWCIASLGVPLLIVAGCGDGAAASAAAPAPPDDRNAVLTALAVFPLAVPDPVLAADGQVHLAYELIAMNQSSATVTLQEVQVLDSADGRVLDTMAGDALRNLPGFRAAPTRPSSRAGRATSSSTSRFPRTVPACAPWRTESR